MLGPTTRQTKRIKIKALWEEGYSQRQIAASVKCSLATVETWIKRFKEAEAKGIPENIAALDKPRPGANPKITNTVGKAILKYAEGRTGRTAPVIKSHIYNKFGVTLSERRIQQWLKAEGLHPYHRPKRLPLSDHHKKKRVKFARKYKRQDWMNDTLFTDEKQFPLLPKATNTKDDIVWARSIEDVPPAEIDQYSESCLGWGFDEGQHPPAVLRR